MDMVEQLIRAFGALGKPDQSARKLDVLMDLGRLDDPRVVSLLEQVTTDRAQPADVRIDALRRLREAAMAPADRVRAAEAGIQALRESVGIADDSLRLHASLALGDFVDVPGVLDALGALCACVDEPIELRYNAFTSAQRTGPTPSCVELMRVLSTDETLGQSAQSVLVSWGVA